MQDYENHQKEVAPQSYDSHIDGTKLDSVSVYRDLGLLTILSNVLSWNDHIANITSKVNSILGLIRERVGISIMLQLLTLSAPVVL